MSSAQPTPQVIQDGDPASIADYEKAVAELQAIVDRLENGEQSLEASLKDYERGVALEKQCQQALDQAERRIQAIENQAGNNDAAGNQDRDASSTDNIPF